jgi:hypothetical protein
MENLKLIGVEIQKLIQRVRTFSEDICIELEVDNCAKVAMKKNKSLHTHNIYINSEVQDPE